MTYCRTDPATMTPAELADYRQRCNLPDESSESNGSNETVPVTFDESELTRVKQSSSVAGADVATWVHDAALHEADALSDRDAVTG